MRVGPNWLAGLALGLAACGAGRRHDVEGARPPPPPAPSVTVADAAPPPVPGLPIGAAHPLWVIAASRSGKWVAYCQAREDSDGDGRIAVGLGAHGALVGDRLTAQLALDGGTSRAIDAIAAADSSGRWVIASSKEGLTLIDAETGTETPLDADRRADGSPYRRHRAVAFGPDGRSLAYIRRKGATELIAVRDLGLGKEVTVTPAPGSVWRVETEPLAKWLLLQQVTTDADADGRLRWPVAELAAPSPCDGPVPRFAASAPRGDPVTVAVAPLGGGPATPVDGFVVALKAGFVSREADGRLMLRQTPNVELSPASCGARVLHADPSRNLLLIACAAATGRAPLELVGPAFRLPLDVDIAFLGHDTPAGSVERLVPIYPGADTALVDFEKRRLVRLRAGDTVVTTSGPRALVRRGDRLVVSDVDSGIETLMPGTTAPLAVALSTERMGVVSPLVVDTQRGKLLGSVSEQPLAIARDGRVLVALGAQADADTLAVGPLEWRAPEPATGTEP